MAWGLLSLSLCLNAQEPNPRRWRSGTLPGETPGTHRYLMQLRTRTFDPAAILALARREPNPAVRKQILGGLDTEATRDQEPLKQSIAAVGGRLRQSFWTSNAADVEIPQDKVDAVKRIPGVARLWPIEAREPSGLAPDKAFDPFSGTPAMHNFSGAHTISCHDVARVRGAGVAIGFFDSGLDVDANGMGGTNDAFQSTTGSRLLASHLVAGSMQVLCGTTLTTWLAVDCNLAHPYFPIGSKHFDARHGTGSASIALGGNGYGHAPDATAVGWAITRGNVTLTPPPPCAFGMRWLTDDAAMLSAVQGLRTWNADVTSEHRVRVLNISWAGWSDPQHPVEQALDLLGYTENVLVTVSAGNDWDSTRLSHGQYNGLAVGAVDKRYSESQNWTIAAYSSRGPLFGDPPRAFPDVCALGDVDHQHVDHGVLGGSPTYPSTGTSNAAPQIAGAAALYIARRDVYPAAATALETKGAILVSLAEPYRANGSAPQIPGTHGNYNAFGQGFLRDDYLADYAERFRPQMDQAIQARLGAWLPRAAETVSISPSTNPWPEVPWTGLLLGEDYVVAIAWHRPVFEPLGDVYYPLPNVDLEVIQGSGPGAQVIARSASLANSYERVVFRPTATNVAIRVIGRDLHGLTVTVQIAARKHPETLTGGPDVGRHYVRGMVESLPQPCAPVTNPSQKVTLVVPQSYVDTWGSGGMTGVKIPKKGIHVVWEASELPASAHTIRGIWFRTWREHGNSAPRQARVAVLGLAQTNLTLANPPTQAPGQANGGFDVIYQTDPNRATFLADELLVFPEVQGMAQDKDAWLYYLPLWNANPQNPQSFTFSPTADPSRPKLALWLQWKDVSQGVESNPPYVDWATDSVPPAWPGYAAVYLRDIDQQAIREQGTSPIVGMTTGLPGPCMLEAVGEPVSWSASPGVPFAVVFRSADFGPHNVQSFTRYLILSLANPNALLPGAHGCLRLMSDPSPGQALLVQALTTWSVDGVSITPYALPESDSMLYLDLWTQVLEVRNADGSASQASNGLRLRIGGRRQQ